MRAETEQQVYERLNMKIEEFLELGVYITSKVYICWHTQNVIKERARASYDCFRFCILLIEKIARVTNNQ